MKAHVALAGFMGAGKSSIGPVVAALLGRRFVDTDLEIERAHGPIPQLFSQRGEPAFRMLEEAAVREALGGEPSLLALGGGALCAAPTRALLEAQAIRVYLSAAVHTIEERLHRNSAERPMLGPAPSAQSIAALLSRRERFYAACDIIVHVDGQDEDAIAAQIVRCVAAHADYAA